MPTLASSNLASDLLLDSLILLIYFFFMLAAGFSLKPAMTTSTNFMQAGRTMPGWLCSLAMLGASLGSLEVLAMGAAGAQYGLASVAWFTLGSIPVMLFAGLYLMPIFYGSKSGTAATDAKATSIAPRSIPEYLGLRFDQKTRVLNAIMFAAMSAFSAGVALYAMARALVALHVFDRISESLNLPPTGTLLLAMAFPAALVLAYILLGGLGAAMYNQALQFLLIVAGLLPMVLLGLKKIGGWSGLKAQVPANFLDGLTQTASWLGPLWSALNWRGLRHLGGWPCARRRDLVHGFPAVADTNGGERCAIRAESSHQRSGCADLRASRLGSSRADCRGPAHAAHFDPRLQ